MTQTPSTMLTSPRVHTLPATRAAQSPPPSRRSHGQSHGEVTVKVTVESRSKSRRSHGQSHGGVTATNGAFRLLQDVQ